MAHPIAPARALQQVGRVGHRFGAAGHDDVDVADAQRLDRVDNGLQSGAADAVDRFRRHLERQPRFQRRLPRDVHAGARLKHASEHDVADVGRRDAGARDRFADRDRAEIDSRHIFQRAAERPNRRAAGAQDDGSKSSFTIKALNRP